MIKSFKSKCTSCNTSLVVPINKLQDISERNVLCPVCDYLIIRGNDIATAIQNYNQSYLKLKEVLEENPNITIPEFD